MATLCLNGAILVSSLYLCQFNSDLYETLNLAPGVPTSYPALYIQLEIPKKSTPCLKGAILVSSLYLCQFNSDLYETLNLSSWGTNQLSQLL